MVGRVTVVGREQLTAVGALLTAEADSRRLKLELGAMFKAAAGPIMREQRDAIMAIPSKGHPRDPERIRDAMAESLVLRTRFTPASAGITIRARTTPEVRRFTQAPRRFNQKRPFRHPFFGNRDRWYSQKGSPQWFTNGIYAHIPEMADGCMMAILAMEARIAARTRAAGRL